jgi:hypothetical protein
MKTIPKEQLMNRHELLPFFEHKATYLHSHHALTDPYCQQ